ncbi:MAG: hypothetical protein FWE40_09310 [Oscillospiraceae bacterium]|nr:hypothetical protein [Oscillospiraceae bacterium]
MENYIIYVPVPIMDAAIVALLQEHVVEVFLRGDEIIIRPVPEDDVRAAFGEDFGE